MIRKKRYDMKYKSTLGRHIGTVGHIGNRKAYWHGREDIWAREDILAWEDTLARSGTHIGTKSAGRHIDTGRLISTQHTCLSRD